MRRKPEKVWFNMREKDRTGKADLRADFRRRLPRAVLLFAAVIGLECWMISSIFQARYDARNQEYVVLTAPEYEIQMDVPVGVAGLMGSFSALENYSETSRNVSLSGGGENMLAGVEGLDRRIIRRQLFRDAAPIAKAGQLGSLAELLVLNNKMSDDDYWAIVRITEAETNGGDIMSKMMVAGVVLNRVEDDRFPDTVYDVVFQESQFSPVEDGRYYSCTITDDTLEAVDRVLSGEDYSEGALYFVARDSADSSKVQWFETDLTWLFSYGGHDFYTY